MGNPIPLGLFLDLKKIHITDLVSLILSVDLGTGYIAQGQPDPPNGGVPTNVIVSVAGPVIPTTTTNSDGPIEPVGDPVDFYFGFGSSRLVSMTYEGPLVPITLNVFIPGVSLHYGPDSGGFGAVYHWDWSLLLGGAGFFALNRADSKTSDYSTDPFSFTFPPISGTLTLTPTARGVTGDRGWNLVVSGF